jgi:hypothetical protein
MIAAPDGNSGGRACHLASDLTHAFIKRKGRFHCIRDRRQRCETGSVVCEAEGQHRQRRQLRCVRLGCGNASFDPGMDWNHKFGSLRQR